MTWAELVNAKDNAWSEYLRSISVWQFTERRDIVLTTYLNYQWWQRLIDDDVDLYAQYKREMGWA
jgi:hypothetical protein